MSNEIKFTGERYMPSEKGQLELEHLHRYMLVIDLVKGKTVLDIASGEGYGSALIAESAKDVIGVDVDEAAINHANDKYILPNLEYRHGRCDDIPLADSSIDVIVSFETIEHHDKHTGMMQEIKRVLKPEGLLIVSSPDKLEYSDKPNYSNEYHVKELYIEEFKNLLNGYFKSVNIFGQRVVYGSAIFSEVTTNTSNSFYKYGVDKKSFGMPNPVYDIAIASDAILPALGDSFYEQDINASDILCERDTQIESLNAVVKELADHIPVFQRTIIDRENEIEVLKSQRRSDIDVISYENEINSLNEEFGRKTIAFEDEINSLNLQVVSAREETDSTREANSLGERLAETEKHLDLILNSTSWRLTNTARIMVGMLRRIRGGIEKFVSASRGFMKSFFLKNKISNDFTSKPKEEDIPRNILLVSYYCPSRSHAGGLRILDLYTMIRKKFPHISIDLFTCKRPAIDVGYDDLDEVFDRVYFSDVDKLTVSALQSVSAQTQTYNVVDIQFHQAAYDLEGFREIGAEILFTPMELLTASWFIELRRIFSGNVLIKIKNLARNTKGVFQEIVFSYKADKVVCVSNSDARVIRNLTRLRNIIPLETGLSHFEFCEDIFSESYTLKAPSSKKNNLVFVAYYGSPTNIDALKWFLEKVHPILCEKVENYVFSVVGRGDLSSFYSYQDETVELIGEVSQLSDHIEKAKVAISPALGGSGFRGKINQYSILGVPCVASPIAATGVSYINGEEIFICDDSEDFAGKCIELLLNNELNKKMGLAARRSCLNKYTWESKWDTVLKLYNLENLE